MDYVLKMMNSVLKMMIYVLKMMNFSTTGDLGITATGTMMQGGLPSGVFAIDYTLNDISKLLNSTRVGQEVCQRDVCWSYIVERTGERILVLQMIYQSRGMYITLA